MGEYIHLKFKQKQLGIYNRQLICAFYGNRRSRLANDGTFTINSIKFLFDFLLRFHSLDPDNRDKVCNNLTEKEVLEFCIYLENDHLYEGCPENIRDVFLSRLISISYRYSISLTERLIKCTERSFMRKKEKIHMTLKFTVFYNLTIERYHLLPKEISYYKHQSARLCFLFMECFPRPDISDTVIKNNIQKLPNNHTGIPFIIRDVLVNFAHIFGYYGYIEEYMIVKDPTMHNILFTSIYKHKLA